MATYLNPWHREKDRFSEGPHYATDAVPAAYRGYLIYQRVPGGIGVGVWDVVKDGTCITQLAGPNGARRAIDNLLNECKE